MFWIAKLCFSSSLDRFDLLVLVMVPVLILLLVFVLVISFSWSLSLSWLLMAALASQGVYILKTKHHRYIYLFILAQQCQLLLCPFVLLMFSNCFIYIHTKLHSSKVILLSWYNGPHFIGLSKLKIG